MPRLEGVELHGVTRVFGPTLALKGVDLELRAPSITVLEGANGAGKSTLLAVIGTLLLPSSGSVMYHPFGDDRAAARAEIGWVAHDSQCYRDLTARQNVELAARLHGVAPGEGWSRVAQRVSATTLAERRFGTLSRGQRQRVALARALVHSPSLLLLDEPWTGLDAASARELEDVVVQERERGALVVVVSHDSSLADRLGARRVRLQNGRVRT